MLPIGEPKLFMFIPVLLEQLNLLHLFRLLDASDIQYMKSSNTTKPCTSRRACNKTKTTSFISLCNVTDIVTDNLASSDPPLKIAELERSVCHS